MTIWLVPTIVLLFLLTFVVVLWNWYSRRAKYSDPTTDHSERIYRDFEFFIKIIVPLVGGLGYTKLTFGVDQPEVARQAMRGIGALGMLAMTTLSIFVACHQASKIRRWQKVEWKTLLFWQEVWMLLSMYLLGTGLWIAAWRW